jgi:hypothetical protein
MVFTSFGRLFCLWMAAFTALPKRSFPIGFVLPNQGNGRRLGE